MKKRKTLFLLRNKTIHMTNYSQKLPSPVTFTVSRMRLDIKCLQQKVTGDGKNQQKKEDVAGEPVTSSM